PAPGRAHRDVRDGVVVDPRGQLRGAHRPDVDAVGAARVVEAVVLDGDLAGGPVTVDHDPGPAVLRRDGRRRGHHHARDPGRDVEGLHEEAVRARAVLTGDVVPDDVHADAVEAVDGASVGPPDDHVPDGG